MAAMAEQNAALQAQLNAQPAFVPARDARKEDPLRCILFFKFRQRLSSPLQRLSSPLPTPRSRWSMKDKYPSHELTEAEVNECKSPAEEEAWKREHVVAGLLGPNASVQAREYRSWLASIFTADQKGSGDGAIDNTSEGIGVDTAVKTDPAFQLVLNSGRRAFKLSEAGLLKMLCGRFNGSKVTFVCHSSFACTCPSTLTAPRPHLDQKRHVQRLQEGREGRGGRGSKKHSKKRKSKKQKGETPLDPALQLAILSAAAAANVAVDDDEDLSDASADERNAKAASAVTREGMLCCVLACVTWLVTHDPSGALTPLLFVLLPTEDKHKSKRKKKAKKKAVVVDARAATNWIKAFNCFKHPSQTDAAAFYKGSSGKSYLLTVEAEIDAITSKNQSCRGMFFVLGQAAASVTQDVGLGKEVFADELDKVLGGATPEARQYLQLQPGSMFLLDGAPKKKVSKDGWVAEPNRGRKPNFVVLKQAKVLSTPSRAPEPARFLLVLSQFSYATLILLLPTIGRL